MKVVEQILKSGIQLEARQVSKRGSKFGITFEKGKSFKCRTSTFLYLLVCINV